MSTPKQISAPSRHSTIVGGSTAKRVINCTGSVALSKVMPQAPSSSYADEGTLLHSIISDILANDVQPVVGSVYGTGAQAIEYTQEMHTNKILKALDLLDTEVDPDRVMEFEVEKEVSFGTFMPGAFGSTDLIGRIGRRAIVLDWKFGEGVMVEADENEQLMYYAAAAMRTEDTRWAFEDIDEIEVIIIQPPYIRRWVTDRKRVEQFERQLKTKATEAAKLIKVVDALIAEHGSVWIKHIPLDFPIQQGDHCRWCRAKAICPRMTGAVERAVKINLQNVVDVRNLALALQQSDLLEQWIKDLRAMAHQALENGIDIPGWKLVQKRATRKWVDEAKAKARLLEFGEVKESDITRTEFLSVAQCEKVFKTHKLELPEGLVESVSSGTTIAEESDSRPAALIIGKQLSNALGKLKT